MLGKRLVQRCTFLHRCMFTVKGKRETAGKASGLPQDRTNGQHGETAFSRADVNTGSAL